MHPTNICKLKSSEKKIFFQYSFIPKNMILPFLSQKLTHDWQVQSICCNSSPYEEPKEFNDFNFTIFLQTRKETQIKIYAFLNHFSILTALFPFFLNTITSKRFLTPWLWICLVLDILEKKSSSIYLKKKYWKAIMIVIWSICHHYLLLKSPAPRVTWLVDFMKRKLIYHVMPNLLKLGVASQKTFIMQESFKINQ